MEDEVFLEHKELLEYEELVDKLINQFQNGEINDLEFVEMNPDLKGEFKTYIEKNMLPHDIQSAKLFLKYLTDKYYDEMI